MSVLLRIRFENYFYFVESRLNTAYELMNDNKIKIKKRVSLNQLQCKRLAFSIYDNKGAELSLVYKAKSIYEICENNCQTCYQELDTGDKCGKPEFRWHYSLKKEACSEFIYNGCGGNDNSFKTFEDCNNSCNNTKGMLIRKINNNKDLLSGFFFIGWKHWEDLNDFSETTLLPKTITTATTTALREETKNITLFNGEHLNKNEENPSEIKNMETTSNDDGSKYMNRTYFNILRMDTKITLLKIFLQLF